MKYDSPYHNRRSIRLQGYDYSQNGLYFITICCQERECYFGEIAEDATQDIDKQPKMVLNEIGNIANQCWMEIPEHFPNAVLHEHIVMPNHVHGIIELTGIVGTQNAGVQNIEPDSKGVQNVRVQNFEPLQHDTIDNVGAQNIVPIREGTIKRNAYQKIIPHSIGSIIRGYKIGVTKWVRSNSSVQNIWQRNFHEHIIRNKQSHETIANYIMNNPSKWKEDKFYKE